MSSEETAAVAPRYATPGAFDYALLVGLAMLWGSSFLFIKLAVASLPPASLTTYRMIVASAVLVPIALWSGERFPRGVKTWGLVAMVSIFGTALPFTLINWGEERIDSGLASILMGAMPLYTLVLAHFFARDEGMTWAKVVGVLFGLAGLVILVGPGKLANMGDDTVRQLAVAGAALCYAINAVMTKSLLYLPRLSAAASIMLAAALIMIPVSFLVEQPLSVQPDGAAIVSTVLLGALHTAVAALVMMKILDRQGASFFGQINLLVPIFGVLWGTLFLSERPGLNHLLALVLILGGVAISRGISGFYPAKNRT